MNRRVFMNALEWLGITAVVCQKPLIASKPIIHRGDIFLCENGHPMCEAIDDIELGESPWLNKIGKWRQTESKLGDPWPVCEICGARLVLIKGWINT